MHSVVLHGKTRHIASPDDDSDNCLPWNTVGIHRLVEVVHRNEVVVVRRDIISQVDPGVIIINFVIESLRRQRSPPEIVVVLTPGHPGRSPVIPGHPHPSVLGDKYPAPIVVDRPSEGLVREPGPSLIGIHPTTPGVGPPCRIGPQCRWLPYESVVPSLKPLTKPRKLCEENLVVPGIKQGYRNSRLKSHCVSLTWSKVIIL